MQHSESPATPELAVVVPTHNRLDSLASLLDGLAIQTLPHSRWEAVIVDDGSREDVAATIRQMVSAALFPVRCLRLDPGGGPAVARNAGWRSTTAPVVAFIDDDCVPHAEWLQSGLAGFTNPDVGVVQGRTVRPADSANYPHTPFTVVREVLAPSPWFEACNIFFRRSALEQAGGFDESFGRFPCGEDTNLGWSVIGSGWERSWSDDAVVEHELSERPWVWHLRFHWLEGNTVYLASRYPEIRTMFWRSWAIKQENALFGLAVGGLIASLRFRAAVLAAIPYVAWLGPGKRVGAIGGALQVTAHAASLAGKLRASLRYRTFVL